MTQSEESGSVTYHVRPFLWLIAAIAVPLSVPALVERLAVALPADAGLPVMLVASIGAFVFMAYAVRRMVHNP